MVRAASAIFVSFRFVYFWRSNVTGRHQGPKRTLRAGYRAPSLQRTSYPCELHFGEASSILHRQVWYRALSLRARAMRVFDIRASSSPLGYSCAKFRFCRALHRWANPRRKITYSITQSLTKHIWSVGNRSWSLRNNKINETSGTKRALLFLCSEQVTQHTC